MTDAHMARALSLARQAQGSTSPNPPVGAVLVKDGKTVAEGFTGPAGQAHAEIVALRAAGEEAAGSTLYVTLEPCSHWGRTPPCSDALIAAGVRAVHIAVLDPNPSVNGAGKLRLEQHGIAVTTGECREAADELVEAHARYITSGRPFVTLLLQPPARVAAELERITDSILADCSTSPRGRRSGDESLRPPLRVVLGDRVSQELPDDPRTIVATGQPASFPLQGVQESRILRVPAEGGKIDYPALFEALGRHEITSCLVTGSDHLAQALLSAGLVDKIVARAEEPVPAGFAASRRVPQDAGYTVLYPAEGRRRIV